MQDRIHNLELSSNPQCCLEDVSHAIANQDHHYQDKLPSWPTARLPALRSHLPRLPGLKVVKAQWGFRKSEKVSSVLLGSYSYWLHKVVIITA